MRNPTLFDSPYDQAVRDMIEQFKRQLKTAETPLERKELETAIRSWTAALEPPKKPTKPKRRK